MNDETGWIIEQYVHSVLVYWTGDGTDFSRDSLMAVRFARQTDAERMLTWHLKGDGRVAEHMWMDKKQ